ncbi:MAG: universal stress protein [Hyphomonadaceae bacterium]|nr:universal stress protein [Hyphomonadaceae bacterium]
MYRSILVHVDSSAAGRTRVAAAAELATRFSCTLTGAFLSSSRLPRYLVGDVLTPIPQDVQDGYVQERQTAIAAASKAAKEVFASVIPHDVRTHWLDIDGYNDDRLIACAKRHDLVILPPEITPAFTNHVIPAARVGMASGGPVLVLKHGGFPIPLGRKVLIAWNESREAVRAVRDAWPLLETASEIHLLQVGPAATRAIDALMQRQLADHECPPATLHVDDGGDTAVEDIIRLHVGRTGADLVVLGLYGHSRLRELVMGGVSRSLLSDPPMPLIMSH